MGYSAELRDKKTSQVLADKIARETHGASCALLIGRYKQYWLYHTFNYNISKNKEYNTHDIVIANNEFVDLSYDTYKEIVLNASLEDFKHGRVAFKVMKRMCRKYYEWNYDLLLKNLPLRGHCPNLCIDDYWDNHNVLELLNEDDISPKDRRKMDLSFKGQYSKDSMIEFLEVCSQKSLRPVRIDSEFDGSFIVLVNKDEYDRDELTWRESFAHSDPRPHITPRYIGSAYGKCIVHGMDKYGNPKTTCQYSFPDLIDDAAIEVEYDCLDEDERDYLEYRDLSMEEKIEYIKSDHSYEIPVESGFEVYKEAVDLLFRTARLSSTRYFITDDVVCCDVSLEDSVMCFSQAMKMNNIYLPKYFWDILYS